MADENSLEYLMLVQAQILRFRRMAASGRFSPENAKQLREIADTIEADARKVDSDSLKR